MLKNPRLDSSAALLAMSYVNSASVPIDANVAMTKIRLMIDLKVLAINIMPLP